MFLQHSTENKRTTIVALSWLGISLSLLFAAVNISRNLPMIAAAELVTGLLFALNLAYILRTGRIAGPSIAGIVIIAILLLLVAGASGVHAYFWIYPLPLLAYFLLGLRLGTVINVVLLAAFSVSLAVTRPEFVHLGLVELDIILSYLVVGLLTLMYELQRRRHYAEITRVSNTDALTGALNRRQLYPIFHREIERAERYRTPLSVIMFDIDHYKEVNDQYGHQCGDTLLVRLVGLIQEHIRSSDVLVRYGGDEFLILAPESDIHDARQLATKLCNLAAREDFGQPEHITLSLGVAEWTPGSSAERLVRAADAALYKAKEAGRNRVFVPDDGADAVARQAAV